MREKTRDAKLTRRDYEEAGTTADGSVSPFLNRQRLSVLVLSPQFLATYELPTSGELIIGRSRSVDIYVDDPKASRRHAMLVVGPTLEVRDLGSCNGTRIAGRQVAAGVDTEIEVGTAVTVGSTTILVQRGHQVSLPNRRFWQHEDFEVRIEEECARSERSKGNFTLVRMLVDRSASRFEVWKSLANSLRSSDVVGEFGPADFEILLVDTVPRSAEAAVQRIHEHLARKQIHAWCGLAHFPTHGRTASELTAYAQDMVRERQRTTHQEAPQRPVVVVDPVMRALYQQTEKLASGDLPILILGETGVGKEVMAEEIHRRSRRQGRPFLALSCAALSETLLEGELFGHERGAFTDAVRAKPGLLETANGGTVFLDEIGELPVRLQVKLLRVIEEKRVLRVGGLKPRALDIRYISATNRDLENVAVKQGLFREDLFFRLAGAVVNIPPLRERPEDIEPLALSFLTRASEDSDGTAPRISADAIAAMRAYRWPGNIRELRNVLERAVLCCGGDVITLEHLPPSVRRGDVDASLAYEDPDDTVTVEPSDLVADTEERERIEQVLAEFAGNQSRAAHELGLSRGALIRRIQKYGLLRPRKSLR
jgi:DNA-binding NtrC family response regulator